MKKKFFHTNSVGVITTILLLLITLLSLKENDFLSEQLKNARVRKAMAGKQNTISELLKKHEIEKGKLNVLITAFKEEGKLVLYGKNSGEKKYQLLKSYDICASSGKAGPKRAAGDGQVPEGFYKIDRFNPWSNFYLSLGVSYPNKSDRILCKGKSTGGDIFIHGNCVTIGCMPMTDDKIEEIYLLAVYARNNGQLSIPVYIFPFEMNDTRYKAELAKIKDSDILKLWPALKKGYDFFTTSNAEIPYSINDSGLYIIQ